MSEGGLNEDRRDAERWRALMASQRFHIMAMSGFLLSHRDGDETNRSKANLEPVPQNDVMFIKMEFWSEYKAKPFKDAFERELMERYADEMVERLRKIEDGATSDNCDEVHMRPLQADADL